MPKSTGAESTPDNALSEHRALALTLAEAKAACRAVPCRAVPCRAVT